MTEEEWWRFVASGDPAVVSVTRLPADLCRAVRSQATLIRIRHGYTLKMLHKHNVPPEQLGMLSLTIDIGRAVLEPRGQTISFFHYDDVVFGGWFHAAVKATWRGDELWVTTFHRSKPGEVSRLTRRGIILRPDPE